MVACGDYAVRNTPFPTSVHRQRSTGTTGRESELGGRPRWLVCTLSATQPPDPTPVSYEPHLKEQQAVKGRQRSPLRWPLQAQLGQLSPGPSTELHLRQNTVAETESVTDTQGTGGKAGRREYPGSLSMGLRNSVPVFTISTLRISAQYGEDCEEVS